MGCCVGGEEVLPFLNVVVSALRETSVEVLTLSRMWNFLSVSQPYAFFISLTLFAPSGTPWATA